MRRRPAPIALAALVFAAFVAGRLVMEPTGAGLVLLLLATPLVAGGLMVAYGRVAGILMAATLALVALLARAYFILGGPWVALLLLPAAMVSGAITIRVIRILLSGTTPHDGGGADAGHASNGAEPEPRSIDGDDVSRTS